MHKPAKFAAALVALSAVAGLTSVDANALPRCRAAVEGVATATGILGTGSEKARIAARQHWKATVRHLYGPRYANFWTARDKQWDCKKGAILLAKCVVVARPCRY
ncbi:hypothetical protein [Hyphomicrobium sp.]|jgi:hypothetical protein|uniref:hypothetical protein n=1 Tax=Hyphomicrobium sp. TaxID=82 RepID=UPI002BF60730|nr:hypothetical protein [Hyphomicrobium sp.]HVZ03272.1 hypothetical protein [Hyphomicrobium sp.]